VRHRGLAWCVWGGGWGGETHYSEVIPVASLTVFESPLVAVICAALPCVNARGVGGEKVRLVSCRQGTAKPHLPLITTYIFRCHWCSWS
jgi:hypothetical protein